MRGTARERFQEAILLADGSWASRCCYLGQFRNDIIVTIRHVINNEKFLSVDKIIKKCSYQIISDNFEGETTWLSGVQKFPPDDLTKESLRTFWLLLFNQIKRSTVVFCMAYEGLLWVFRRCPMGGVLVPGGRYVGPRWALSGLPVSNERILHGRWEGVRLALRASQWALKWTH